MKGMNLFKHKNGNWWLLLAPSEHPPYGTRISLKKIVGHPVKDRLEATEIMAMLTEEQLKARLAELDKTSRISLKDFIDEFTTGERADLSEETLRADRLALRLLADVVGPSRSIQAINKADLIKFKTVCLGRNLSKETVKTYMRHIKGALNYAADNAMRGPVPKFPKIKTPRRLPRALPPDTVNEILTWLKQNDFETWRYAAFAVWTGCRRSECCGLQWQKIHIYDSPRNGIYGHASVIGKGDKERTIYLSEGAIEALGPPKDIGRVLYPWTKHTVTHKFKAGARAAGHGDAHFHLLRHTAATMMLSAGMRLETVRKILGHVDIRTTELYAEVLDKVVQEDFSKFSTFNLGK